MSKDMDAAAHTAYIALGGNLGDAAATVRRAFAALAALPQTRLLAASSLYRSAPVDASGPDFINAAASVATSRPSKPPKAASAPGATPRARSIWICSSTATSALTPRA